MSKHATLGNRAINYEGMNVAIPEGWEIVFKEDDDGSIHAGDMLITYDGRIMSLDELELQTGVSEVGGSVASKICVIRKMKNDKAIKKEFRRMKPKEFIDELQRLHR